MNYLNVAFALARLILIACACMPFAIGWRTPLFAGWRITALVDSARAAAPVDRHRNLDAARTRLLRAPCDGSAACRSCLALPCASSRRASLEITFQYQAPRGAATPIRAKLEQLGRHILVGYRNEAILYALIDRRAVAGVFISAGNVRRTRRRRRSASISSRCRTGAARRICRHCGSRLTRRAALSRACRRRSPACRRISEIVALHPDHAERKIAVGQYAARQGRELAALGVNLESSRPWSISTTA